MVDVQGLKFKGVIFDAKANNSRFVYSQEIVDRELRRYADVVNSGNAFGQLNPNPDDNFYKDPMKFAFIITKLQRNDEGVWDCTGETLMTPNGKLLRTLLVNDPKMKLCLTGIGEADDNNIVSDDYYLHSIDMIPDNNA